MPALEKEGNVMRGYRPSYFATVETSDVDLLLEDRAGRITDYARRAAARKPLFEESHRGGRLTIPNK
ncbi:MAG: hypothetical protein NT031_02985 [Planctomycetota bacterium]|nr:hypothetical protein [Planctomycetota bacterium]